MGFPGDSDGKESTFNARDLCLIPELGRFPGGGHGNPLQYSCLENPHGQRRMAGYSLWGRKELDTTERPNVYTHTHTHTHKNSLSKNKDRSLRWIKYIQIHAVYINTHIHRHIYTHEGSMRLSYRTIVSYYVICCLITKLYLTLCNSMDL